MITVKTVAAAFLTAALVAVLAGALVLIIRDGEGPQGAEIFLPTATPMPDLKVYVSGAVRRPGVYTMRHGDRLSDALAASGGASEDAQMSCVNLAVRVRDEAHYHVPGAGEACVVGGGSTAQEARREGIDLNTASPGELETLPGIGPVKAKAIVDYREQAGGFGSVSQVMEVTGIGPATYESIRDLVYVEQQPVSQPKELSHREPESPPAQR